MAEFRKVDIALMTLSLGGPFLDDNSLVFEAAVDKKQYWKIETKNTYTSKGWEQPFWERQRSVILPGMDMGELSDAEGIRVIELKLAQLTMTEKFPFIIYPYGMTNVRSDEDVSIFKYSRIWGISNENWSDEVRLILTGLNL